MVSICAQESNYKMKWGQDETRNDLIRLLSKHASVTAGLGIGI